MHYRDAVRDDHNGLYKLVLAVDHVMFGNAEQPASHQTESDDATPLAQLVCRETVYTADIACDSAVLLSDIMKTVFNITLNWCDKANLSDVSDLQMYFHCYVFPCLCYRKSCMCLSVLLIS